MQQQMGNVEDYSINDLETLIESIRRKTGMNEEEIARKLKYNDGYIAQTRSRGKVSIKFIQALQSLLPNTLQIAKEGESGYTSLSLNNLTESNKVLAEANRTLAEANKTLAEANHVISKNHDELIQLTKMIVANSAASPKNQPVTFGPEGNKIGHGFGAVTPLGTQAKTDRPKGKR